MLMHPYAVSCALVAAMLVPCPISASAEAGSAPEEQDIIRIGSVWAGVRMNYSAVSDGAIVYVAYYDADREFCVSRIDTQKRQVVTKKMGSFFSGWDAHNSAVLSLDKFGVLHAAANMHSSPLVYARMLTPRNFESFVRVREMTGQEENSVTYPTFFTFPDGTLGFSYRSGRSGNGAEIINRFDGTSWRRHTQTAVFASRDANRPVSAYRTNYVVGPDGYFHVAWVWRASALAQSNFNVNYARSKDLKRWVNGSGSPIALPMTPSNSEIAANVPPESGLFNNIRLGFDRRSRPVISFLKFDENGNTQLYHARREESAWTVAKITDWKYRWDFSGRGTLDEDIAFSGVFREGEELVESVKHRVLGRQLISYRDDALQVKTVELLPRPPSAACVNAKPWLQAQIKVVPTTADSFQGSIIWRTLPRGNNDKPRTCEQLGLSDPCSLITELKLMPSKIETADRRLPACKT